ncbi:MAG: hypothetical protein WCJ59_00045 [bacterium]
MSNQAMVVIILLVTFGPVAIHCFVMGTIQKEEDDQIDKEDARRRSLRKEYLGY